MRRDEAQQLQAEADRAHKNLVWLVAEESDGRFTARPITDDGVMQSVLMAESLTELRQMLPPGLVRSDFQPSEIPGIVEVWVSPPNASQARRDRPSIEDLGPDYHG